MRIVNLGNPKFQVECKCGALLEYEEQDIHHLKDTHHLKDIQVVKCLRCRINLMHHEKYRIIKMPPKEVTVINDKD